MFLPLDSGQRGEEAEKWSDTHQQTTRGKGINYIVEGTWTFFLQHSKPPYVRSDYGM